MLCFDLAFEIFIMQSVTFVSVCVRLCVSTIDEVMTMNMIDYEYDLCMGSSLVNRALIQYKDRLIYVWRFPC